jgi:hypothetical protein
MKDLSDNKLASFIAIANVVSDQDIEKLAELEQVLPDKEQKEKLERMTIDTIATLKPPPSRITKNAYNIT